MVIKMKRSVTSKPLFSSQQVAAALAAAPASAVADEDNPTTRPKDWERAVSSQSLTELRDKLSARRRGPQKRPTKVPTTIRFDPDVLQSLKSTGRGWQTRVNEAMREWLKSHAPTA
jgi:uncharacterized protein (DUF4415 family)